MGKNPEKKIFISIKYAYFSAKKKGKIYFVYIQKKKIFSYPEN